MEYRLEYSEFDLSKHVETYTNYLEVIVHPSGKVEYAIPSHQEKLLSILCKKLSMCREDVYQSVPPAWYCDMLDWLCMKTGCIAVWTCGTVAGIPNRFQRHQLNEFVRKGAMRSWDESQIDRNRANVKLLLNRERESLQP